MMKIFAPIRYSIISIASKRFSLALSAIGPVSVFRIDNSSYNTISSNSNSSSSSSSSSSNINSHLSSISDEPLIENYRPTWPFAPQSKAEDVVVPPRTVDDSKLHFEMKATFDHGIALFYPHLKFNPADFKVKLKVRGIVICMQFI